MPSRDNTARDASDGKLRLRTLGDASLDLLRADGVAAEHQEMSKALALVTYLACAPTRKESREHLIDLLWSDLDAEAGQHALRQHLWHLRRRFGDVLVADRKNVSRTGAAIDFDRDALLAAAERGNCESVVDLYRGEFFLGFAAPGSSEFERWSDIERARLRSVFVRCAGQLVREWLSAGRSRDSQRVARRIRDAEPFAQHSWRLLIESHISGGDYLGASVEADAFEQMLANEGMEAEPASRAMMASAQRGSTPGSDAAKAQFSDLVGREMEFGWLMKAWNSATTGQCNCVHIVAPAGLGKTRLLQDFRARLASLRARIVVARADAGSGSIPLSFVSDLVAALGAVPGAGGVTPEVASVLVGLAPSLASTYPAASAKSGSKDEPHVRRSAIRDLLTAIAEERPLAVLIDDLHWSDRESASLLAGAVGALNKQRVLVVVAQRPTESVPHFHSDAQQFALSPLSDSAIGALLANVATLPTARWSKALASELRLSSGGSPLLVVENLQLALQRDVLAVTDGEWRCRDADTLTELLHAGGAVRQRVERLEPRELAIARLLSIAQLPLPVDVLCAASPLNLRELGTVLTSMEQLGLVRRAHDQWAIGHDEYAAATLSGLTPDDARSLHSALGHALKESTEVTARQRRLATRHLRLANDWTSLHTMFARVAYDKVRSRDRRSQLAVAADFLGTDASDDDAQRLVSGLPLDIRVGLVTPSRRVAAVFVLAAPVAALWLALTPAATRKATPDHIALVISGDSAGGSIIQELPFSDRAQNGDSTIVLRGPDVATTHISQTYGGPIPSPANTDEWLTVRAVADSGTTDIFLVNSTSGAERRLTFARGDDIDPIWSPDAKLIVFATSRWSALGHTNLAVLERGTGVVRRLTSNDGSDTGPSWSPDGSQVAFARRTFDAQNAICIVLVDGRDERCYETIPTGAPRGWISDSVLLAVASTPPDYELAELNVRTGVRRSVGHLAAVPSLSPDGHWIACDCRADASTQPRVMIMRSENLAVHRRVVISDPRFPRPEFYWRSSGLPRYVETLTFTRTGGEPLLGVPYRLAVKAFDAAGAVRGSPRVQFSVSDTLLATVTPAGMLTGIRPGLVTVRASAGGWRTDTMTLRIRSNARDTLAVEHWEHALEPSWVVFGEPRATIVTDLHGKRHFNTAGDGQFHSGAFTSTTYQASGGLTLTTTISTPVTLAQWQELEIDLHAGIDTAKVRMWNSRAGYLWNDGRTLPVGPACGFKYPAGNEGARYAEQAIIIGARNSVAAPAPPSLRTGQQSRLTIQLFPDGRCGVAIDGIALGIADETATIAKPIRLLILGNSYKTKSLVGPLTLTRGVDTTIDWNTRRPPESPVTSPRTARTAPPD